MLPLPALAVALATAQGGATPRPAVNPPLPKTRFELMAPLPTIPAVVMDAYGNGFGVAQQVARHRNAQARILWIDATANIERYDSDEKIAALAQQIKAAGFNTVVFDIKPISGQVVYPSKLAPKLTEWRGKTMALEYDPLAAMVREIKGVGLTLFVSMNAFSEGHRMFLVGPGYGRLDQQTVIYEPTPIIRSPYSKDAFPLSITPNAADPAAVSVFTTPDRLPADSPNAAAVIVDTKQSRVLSRLVRTTPTPLPRNAVVLYGTDAGAEFLRLHAVPGLRIEFATQASFLPISERPLYQIPLMMNPNHPEVQRYALDIVREVVTNYAVDGLIYDDRLRYGGINADFSEITRSLFEKRVGRPLRWPEDVFEFTITPTLQRGIRPGPYYDAWMAWRAATLKEFVRTVRTELAQIRPGAQLGVYAGSWYGEYPAFGNNWASPRFESGFWFLTPDYQRTGFAPLVDFLITGCYYPVATIHEAMSKAHPIGSTVEAGGMLTNRAVRDEAWSYAGISLADFKDNPEGLQDVLQAACASTQGVMVFDLSHDIEPMWPIFGRAFAQPRTAPHAIPGLLAHVRRRRAARDKAGLKDPPVIISSGASGVGL